ncbi:alpha-amylase family glycosyl hydrolase [Succinimonas amylolytica]|uniref:alpha-amylase family glycosyl hydrolase n=1 Tax=Succinimonas amylolytica TaxID=83769 RepID=UPI0003A6B3C0|nr:alpha-amylase family glycosyl hydrolase [Succinimonas amylolytica]
MKLIRNRRMLLAAAVSAIMFSGSAYAANYEEEMIIVHPFQWSYDSIAKECTEFLGPAGYDGVQISQPAEHINRSDVWWAVYQPISFTSFTTMTGNEQQLKNMIKACNKAGVKVFADAVFNQRGSDSGTGIGGTGYGYKNYNDGFDGSDFHGDCSITGYTNADIVRNCALSGMPDTATDNPSTQYKIAQYLARLMDMGVYGFRIDAAKHMGYNDINAILGKTKEITGRRPPAYLEVIGAPNEAADIQPDKYTFIENAVVTDFGYVWDVKQSFGSGNYGKALELSTWLGDNAEVFVNNHDDEWGRASAGSSSMKTQNNPDYDLAQSWLVVWPVGKVRQVYSGFKFDVKDSDGSRVSDQTHDQGGPISSPRCEGGWLCQHRNPIVLQAARFARATRGQKVTSKGFDNGALWINRGSKGFYVMNTTDSEFEREFNVEVPDGTYKNILSSNDSSKWSDITVSGGKAKIKVGGKSAAAICVGEFCGKAIDPCVSDPNSAGCLCKDDSDKFTCSAYCNTHGFDSVECSCKGQSLVNGVCTSYCSENLEADGCHCLMNPDADDCQSSYEATHGKLCYAGSSNGWTHDPMTFNKRTGMWTIDLVLTGEGEKSGSKQRFKITDGCDWIKGKIYGVGSGNKLALNEADNSDVDISSYVGEYTLSIRDSDMSYTLTEKQAAPDVTAAFTASVKNLTVTIANSSSGSNLSYKWDFGDGKTSTDKAPSHTYEKSGTYTIKLTVKSGSASATQSKKVTVSSGSTVGTITKVAIRSSEDGFGTTMMQKGSGNVWTIENYQFSTDGKFKIEALNGSQCIILGGKNGESLTAAGGFVPVSKGVYDITFNSDTMMLTVKEHAVTPDPEPDPEPSDNTKKNCDADSSTTNCEKGAYTHQTLGATYYKDRTVFRLWSPDSSNVSVDVKGKTYSMTKASLDGYSDVYEVTVQGDLDGVPYQFKVNGNAVRDPYGKMVVPASYNVNGKSVTATDNRNVVMNMRATDLANGWAKRPVLTNREDAIIYEAHVRDFTVDPSSGVDADKRGRYLGMVQTGTTNNGMKTGIDHLKELGVTHVQLLPVYDYGTCSDVDSQDDSCYNWGYDPVNFNVPEDRYTSVHKSENYKQKVKEFKTMVDEFHKNGIRVIMDVVYNHTYNHEMFQNITGKYYTSVDLSGCGNSVDAKNDMVSRFIRDSLEYWATEYNIDGFRFDLVGIFDVEDFRSWGKYLNETYPDRNFLMYGEPWNGYATDPSEGTRVRMGSIKKAADAHVGVFNGKYRECVKGASDEAAGGFMFNKQYHDLGAGASTNFDCVTAGMKGAIGDNDNPWTPFFAADPEQSINYLTAHDNLNLTDKIKKYGATGDYASRLQAYGNGLMLVSQGIPFIHSGEEFSRTKNMNGNSYNTPGDVNNVKWGLKKTNAAVFNYYRDMIAMRKAHPAFRMTTKSQIEENVTATWLADNAFQYDINGSAVGDSWKKIRVVVNSGNPVDVSGVDGWKKKVDGVTVNADGTSGSNKADGTAVTIWYQN